jgi:three-Cys-motif partner protein
MTQQQPFGGPWTQRKLSSLKGYLEAYMRILGKRPFFETVYVDAFAGTGAIPLPADRAESASLTVPEAELDTFLVGSTRVALEVESPFGRYLFIERSRKKCQELEALKTDYPALANRIEVVQADANAYLTQWCEQTNWSNRRAVMFLDPCGMQVEWALIEAIARTQAIDLWFLVPVGMGLNRMLPQNNLPPDEWSRRVTKSLGIRAEELQRRFYGPPIQPGFFDEEDRQEKKVDHERLKNYIVERLAEVFPAVAPKPLTLRNSKNSPLFLLCFAAANKKGAPTAIRIANHLLKEDYGN